MNKTWIPFFRTGKHKDSKGRESLWTSVQIDSAVTHFNTLSEDEKQKRPLTISHPENNLPVMGFVEKLQRIGDTLYALPGKVADGFKSLVNSGALPERSISFFSDGTVNHFGFLPVGQKAAVPDLGTFNFSEEEAMQVFNFSEGEVAELPSDEDMQSEISKLTLEVETLKADSGSDTAKIEAAENKIKALQAETDKNKAKVNTMQFASQLAENLTPAQKDLILKLHETISLHASDKIEFSDGTSETPENLLLQLSKQFSGKLNFSEFATKRNPTIPLNPESETAKLAAEIKKNMG